MGTNGIGHNRMKKRIVILVIGCFVTIAVGLTFLLYTTQGIYRFFHPYRDQQLAGATTISGNWLEITPKEPLRADRVVQEVVLYVDKPVTHPRDSWELILPDGSKVIPEVQLVDSDGLVYELKEPTTFTKPGSSEAFQRGFSTQLPNGKTFRTVRLRSDGAFTVSKIVWRCYDPRDVS
jgi:hypothetical protein